ncbi:MAG TPA: hypothetical protein VHY19_08970 [Steroidobacteraceae bacterium]|jgi:hypothetical protein|nr:hypothetical protein [Steroidobacteraceae bacterium]
MNRLRTLSLAAGAALALAATAPPLQAQISINIGTPPVCPYGYYDYAPYSCAPYGYYGPDWFVGGVFIGAGPWFHGPRDFHGHVDNHFDPHHGYHGPVPERGAHASRSMRGMHFHGNEMRDGRGHEGGGERGGPHH